MLSVAARWTAAGWGRTVSSTASGTISTSVTATAAPPRGTRGLLLVLAALTAWRTTTTSTATVLTGTVRRLVVLAVILTALAVVLAFGLALEGNKEKIDFISFL